MSALRDRLALSLLVASLAGCNPARGEETVSCTPGAHLWIGCNQACSIGECSGDPWLQICDGDVAVEDCVEGAFLPGGDVDDSTAICFSTCPVAQLVCPASGQVTVTLKGYEGSASSFTCDWRVEERPPASVHDGGAGDASTDDSGAAGTTDGGDAGASS